MRNMFYVTLTLFFIGWSAPAVPKDLGICPLMKGADRADRKFHEGLDAVFAASTQLIWASQEWHRAHFASANTRIAGASADFGVAEAAFSEIPQLDANMEEPVSVRNGVDESEVTAAFERIGYTLPSTSDDVVTYFVKEAAQAQEGLAEKEFTGAPEDYTILQAIGDIVGRTLTLSIGTGGLVAESHL